MSASLTERLEREALVVGPETAPEHASNNWRLTIDGNGFAWLVLDRAGRTVNTLDSVVLEELAEMLDHLEAKAPAGVVLRSAKPAGFAAGADLGEFCSELPRSVIEEHLRLGYAVLDRFEALSMRTVAVIHGHVLDGGSNWRSRPICASPRATLRSAFPQYGWGCIRGSAARSGCLADRADRGDEANGLRQDRG